MDDDESFDSGDGSDDSTGESSPDDSSGIIGGNAVQDVNSLGTLAGSLGSAWSSIEGAFGLGGTTAAPAATVNAHSLLLFGGLGIAAIIAFA
jgi:hypothetical protein